MSILGKAVGSLAEADLQRVVDDRLEETIVLEFKEALDLSEKKQRRELAKDISAMANSSGGIIIYGIREAVDGDGRAVADELRPLAVSDSLQETIDNIVVTSVVPRPTYRSARVDVSGGACFVIRVEQSLDTLHMVQAWGETRYYKRTDKGAHPMSQPDVDLAYERINRFRTQEKRHVDSVLAEEIPAGWKCWLGVVSLPLQHLGSECVDVARLEQSLFHDVQLAGKQLGHAHRFAPSPSGFESAIADRTRPEFLVRLRRDGAVHFGTMKMAAFGEEDAPIWLDQVLRYMIDGVRLANGAWRRLGIYGRYRSVAHVRNHQAMAIAEDRFPRRHRPRIPPQSRVVEHDSYIGTEDDGEALAKRVLDRLYQDAGEMRCPFFDDVGALTSRGKALLGRAD